DRIRVDIPRDHVQVWITLSHLEECKLEPCNGSDQAIMMVAECFQERWRLRSLKGEMLCSLINAFIVSCKILRCLSRLKVRAAVRSSTQTRHKRMFPRASSKSFDSATC